MIKISSGVLRGIVLRSPGGTQTRPSGERLRQGTFNILRNFSHPILESGAVIDLFAGTGAWSIEAMSNGAQHVWMVESHPIALKTLRVNLEIALKNFASQLLDAPQATILAKDVAEAYPRLPEAMVMFCDPPYEQGWFERILKLEASYQRLLTGGILLYEAASREEVPEASGGLRLFNSKNYGDSTVHLFVKDAHAPGNLSG